MLWLIWITLMVAVPVVAGVVVWLQIRREPDDLRATSGDAANDQGAFSAGVKG